MDGTNQRRPSNLETRGRGRKWNNNHRLMVMGRKHAISESSKSSGMRRDMEISDSQARIYAIKQLDSKKRNEPESRGNLPCDAQTEGAANSRVYAGGNLSREKRFGENSEGFTTLSINADLFHLEEETDSQYGNLITTSSQDLLREGRITQGRIGKLKASGPSDRS